MEVSCCCRFILIWQNLDSTVYLLAGLDWHGNLPVSESQGVHSMADVFIYSNGKSWRYSTLKLLQSWLIGFKFIGPGSERFRKTIENWEVFYGLTEVSRLLVIS